MIEQAAVQPETTFVSFDKPLKPEAERTLSLLIERYTDEDGQPLVKFETESLVTLRIPRVVKPKFFDVDAA
jgi:hypothetical protein